MFRIFRVIHCRSDAVDGVGVQCKLWVLGRMTRKPTAQVSVRPSVFRELFSILPVDFIGTVHRASSRDIVTYRCL
jgi:hypothetical protein